MKTCVKCLLPGNFPGIRFDENELCNFCREFRGVDVLAKQQAQYRLRFEELIRAHKRVRGYDVLLCYSGGKDSTYTLAMLRQEFGLKVLAVTFDNGFMPEQTYRNIRQMAERLEIDSVIFKPNFQLLKTVFGTCAQGNIFPAKTLERASAICTACMAIVKFTSLRMALDQHIPFIAYGWSPGQAPIHSALMKNNADMIRLTQAAVYEPLHRLAGEAIQPYFLEERHFRESASFPYNVSPLAFTDYEEGQILRTIRNLGWLPPQDTDPNSTNCLLNAFANQQHVRHYGFHPYAFEISGLIRKGALTREEGQKKLEQADSPEVIAAVVKKLGLEEAAVFSCDSA